MVGGRIAIDWLAGAGPAGKKIANRPPRHARNFRVRQILWKST